MFSKLIKTLSLSTMMSLALSACGEGMETPTVGPDALGQQEAAFTGNWSYSWGDTKVNSTNIGTSVNRTCFLTGIGGNMRPVGAYLYSNGTYPAMAGVRKAANGDYELYVQPDPGKPLIAYARCVNTAAGRIEVTATTGEQSYNGDKILAAANGTRQCFLQDVQNFPVTLKDSNGDIYSYSWAFDDKPNPDEVRVINDGSYWKLSFKVGAHPYPVNIHASAVCFDTSEFDGAWSWKAADPGAGQGNLTSVTGATCGLTGINGHFDTTSGDWNDGVSISTVGSQFKMNVANGKQGWATCMK